MACRVHTSVLGNLENQYCMDCEKSLCNHCMVVGTHTEHRVLTIYRHVCKEVVALEEISRHIDCSGIQV
ncbi:putative transcription factor interactor and regulator Znf-B family [Helianthus anomalus]